MEFSSIIICFLNKFCPEFCCCFVHLYQKRKNHISLLNCISHQLFYVSRITDNLMNMLQESWNLVSWGVVACMWEFLLTNINLCLQFPCKVPYMHRKLWESIASL